MRHAYAPAPALAPTHPRRRHDQNHQEATRHAATNSSRGIHSDHRTNRNSSHGFKKEKIFAVCGFEADGKDGVLLIAKTTLATLADGKDAHFAVCY